MTADGAVTANTVTANTVTANTVTAARLADRAAITEVLARYCHAVDHLDWDELAAVYHPDATDRHGAYQGTAAGFLAWVKPQFTERFAATMHSIGNVLITLDGERALSQCQVRADHLIKPELGGGVFQFWGSYVDAFERRDGQWKILHRVVVRRFVTVLPGSAGNGGGFTLAPGPGYVEYSRSPADPTYWDLDRVAAACAPGSSADRTAVVPDDQGASR